MYQISMFDTEVPNNIVNVSQAKQLSPFRYPGGKTWLTPRFGQWLNSLQNRPKHLIEPFAGGGIISLTAIYTNLVDKCVMIEKDEEVAAVWKTIIYGNWEWLIDRIISFELNVENAREVIQTPCNAVEEEAFKTILKNRICHGGIIAEGSGFLKNGENGKGISSRWYPETISKRIQTIANMSRRIEFIEGDAFDFIERYGNDSDTVLFVDPPYTASKKKAGKRLYKYSQIDHIRLFQLLSKLNSNFMLTYDDDENVINLVEEYGFKYERVAMTGTHTTLRYELLITK